MTNVRFPDSVVIVRDVQYGTGGGRPLRMHILRPRTRRASQQPALIWLHGGGWREGSPWPPPEHLASLVEGDYFVCSVEYRFSQEARFPAQIEDVKCAVRYLRAHAARYGIDPNRIAAWGESAGGHLAAVLGTTGGVAELEGNGGWQDQASNVQAVIDVYGPTDFTRTDAAGDAGSVYGQLLGAAPAQDPDAAARANPITYISGKEPPFIILHGTRDTVVMPSQSELLHEALRAANVPTELVMVPGKGHEDLGADALDKAHAFLVRLLKPAGVR